MSILWLLASLPVCFSHCSLPVSSRHFTRKGRLHGIASIRFYAPDSQQPPLAEAFSTGFSNDLTILRVWQLMGRPKHFELAYGWSTSLPSLPKQPSPRPLATTLLTTSAPAMGPLLTTPDLQLDTPVLVPREAVSVSQPSQSAVCFPPTTRCTSFLPPTEPNTFMTSADLPADVSLLPTGLLLPELSFGLQSPVVMRSKRIQPQLVSVATTMGQ